MAADPVVVTCTADTWVKVADDVTSGLIIRRSIAPNVYKQTFRLAGTTAPTDDSDAALIFGDSNEAQISSNSAIDVYLKAVGVAGEVRVDL